MDSNVDWGNTGYGTGDPTPDGWWDKLGNAMPWIVGGTMGAGALQSAGVLPGGAAASAGGTGPVGGIPLAYAPGATVPNAAALGTSVAGGAGAAMSAADLMSNKLAPHASSILDAMKKLVTTPQGLTGIAALIPALTALLKNGGSNGPFGSEGTALTDEIRHGLTSQRERFDATKPAFETAQNMAIGMAPTRYRSGPYGG
jgi:hypothetical protein